MSRLRYAAGAVVVLFAAAVTSACSGADASTSTNGRGKLRLGYFANVTHATAIVGVDRGFFAESLGGVRLRTQVFTAGPAVVEAIFAGSLDASYVGPNPAVNAFVKSKGEAVRIIAGATSGGASLVVRRDTGITSAAGLRGRTVATPALGNSQDVALRAWLKRAGLRAPLRGTGDVRIVNQENATTLETFRAGEIDAAWVPEPWASRLVLEGDGEVLVDERDLWPARSFVSTHLVVATSFLDDHPDIVRDLLSGHVAATRWITADADGAKAVVNDGIEKLTGKKLAPPVLDRAFSGLRVTTDPLASSLRTSAEHAFDAGLLDRADLAGIYDLTLLNQVLNAAGLPVAGDGGLGKKD